MPASFNIVAEMQVRLVGAQQAVSQLSSAVRSANTQAEVSLSTGRAVTQAKSVSEALAQINAQAVAAGAAASSSLGKASSAMAQFGEVAGVSLRRFVAFTLAVGGVSAIASSLREAVGAAVEFERSMVRIKQVTDDNGATAREAASEIGKIATQYGVSSAELANAAQIFAQAGVRGRELADNLRTVADAALAPNFDSMTSSAEGMIAVMRQFKTDAAGTREAIGAMNAVAGEFAVEGRDLVEVVKRAGGAFAQTKGDVNELLALFTAVRGTTRESAQEISTGLRTIFTRLQRPDTVEALKALRVELRYTREEAQALGDLGLQDQFVGAYEAVRRISAGLSGVQSTDPRFASAIETLGGVRQSSRVLPLIREFATAQKALGTAQAGSSSLTRSSELAQESLAQSTQRVTEQFLLLFRTVSQSDTFQSFARGALSIASALGAILDFARPLVPLLATMATIRIGAAVGDFVGSFFATTTFSRPQDVPRRAAGGPVYKSGPVDLTPGEFVVPPGRAPHSSLSRLNRYADGGWVVPGVGDTDSHRADLPAGSYVIKKKSALAIGHDRLAAMAGGRRRFASGGLAPFFFSGPPTRQDQYGQLLAHNVRTLDRYLEGIGSYPVASGISAGLHIADDTDSPFLFGPASAHFANSPSSLTVGRRGGIEFLEDPDFSLFEDNVNNGRPLTAAERSKFIAARALRGLSAKLEGRLSFGDLQHFGEILAPAQRLNRRNKGDHPLGGFDKFFEQTLLPGADYLDPAVGYAASLYAERGDDFTNERAREFFGAMRGAKKGRSQLARSSTARALLDYLQDVPAPALDLEMDPHAAELPQFKLLRSKNNNLTLAPVKFAGGGPAPLSPVPLNRRARLQDLLFGLDEYAGQFDPADRSRLGWDYGSYIRDLGELALAGGAAPYIPKGSEFIGSGLAALALLAPDGNVIRLQHRDAASIATARYTNFYNEPPHPSLFGVDRPRHPDILQALESGLAGETFVEKVPFAADVPFRPRTGAYDRAVNPLLRRLRDSGLTLQDGHVGNFGLVGGRVLVRDPGAVRPLDQSESHLGVPTNIDAALAARLAEERRLAELPTNRLRRADGGSVNPFLYPRRGQIAPSFLRGEGFEKRMGRAQRYADGGQAFYPRRKHRDAALASLGLFLGFDPHLVSDSFLRAKGLRDETGPLLGQYEPHNVEGYRTGITTLNNEFPHPIVFAQTVGHEVGHGIDWVSSVAGEASSEDGPVARLSAAYLEEKFKALRGTRGGREALSRDPDYFAYRAQPREGFADLVGGLFTGADLDLGWVGPPILSLQGDLKRRVLNPLGRELKRANAEGRPSIPLAHLADGGFALNQASVLGVLKEFRGLTGIDARGLISGLKLTDTITRADGTVADRGRGSFDYGSGVLRLSRANITDQESLRKVLFHELGHAIDYRAGALEGAKRLGSGVAGTEAYELGALRSRLLAETGVDKPYQLKRSEGLAEAVAETLGATGLRGGELLGEGERARVQALIARVGASLGDKYYNAPAAPASPASPSSPSFFSSLLGEFGQGVSSFFTDLAATPGQLYDEVGGFFSSIFGGGEKKRRKRFAGGGAARRLFDIERGNVSTLDRYLESRGLPPFASGLMTRAGIEESEYGGLSGFSSEFSEAVLRGQVVRGYDTTVTLSNQERSGVLAEKVLYEGLQTLGLEVANSRRGVQTSNRYDQYTKAMYGDLVDALGVPTDRRSERPYPNFDYHANSVRAQEDIVRAILRPTRNQTLASARSDSETLGLPVPGVSDYLHARGLGTLLDYLADNPLGLSDMDLYHATKGYKAGERLPRAYSLTLSDGLLGLGKVKMAAGGPSPLSSSVPALLTPEEFVFSPQAVKKIGPRVLDHMNRRGEIPAFHGGGLVGEGGRKKFAGGGPVRFTDGGQAGFVGPPDPRGAAGKLDRLGASADKAAAKLDKLAGESPAQAPAQNVRQSLVERMKAAGKKGPRVSAEDIAAQKGATSEDYVAPLGGEEKAAREKERKAQALDSLRRQAEAEERERFKKGRSKALTDEEAGVTRKARANAAAPVGDINARQAAALKANEQYISSGGAFTKEMQNAIRNVGRNFSGLPEDDRQKLIDEALQSTAVNFKPDRVKAAEGLEGDQRLKRLQGGFAGLFQLNARNAYTKLERERKKLGAGEDAGDRNLGDDQSNVSAGGAARNIAKRQEAARLADEQTPERQRARQLAVLEDAGIGFGKISDENRAKLAEQFAGIDEGDREQYRGLNVGRNRAAQIARGEVPLEKELKELARKRKEQEEKKKEEADGAAKGPPAPPQAPPGSPPLPPDGSSPSSPSPDPERRKTRKLTEEERLQKKLEYMERRKPSSRFGEEVARRREEEFRADVPVVDRPDTRDAALNAGRAAESQEERRRRLEDRRRVRATGSLGGDIGPTGQELRASFVEEIRGLGREFREGATADNIAAGGVAAEGARDLGRGQVVDVLARVNEARKAGKLSDTQAARLIREGELAAAGVGGLEGYIIPGAIPVEGPRQEARQARSVVEEGRKQQADEARKLAARRARGEGREATKLERDAEAREQFALERQFGAGTRAGLAVNTFDEKGNQIVGGDIVKDRAAAAIDRGVSARGPLVSQSTRAEIEREELLRQANLVQRELLSAQKRLLATIYPNANATELERAAHEEVKRALDGEAAVIRDASGRILGTAQRVAQAQQAGVAAPGAGTLTAGEKVGDFFGGVGRAVSGAYRGVRDSRLVSGFNQFFEGAGSGLGTTALLALPYLSAGVSSYGGDVQSAVAGGPAATATYTGANTLAGGLQGGLLGATIGGQLGLGAFGSAIGGAIGAVQGMVSAYRQAAKEILEVKIGAALQIASDRFGALAGINNLPQDNSDRSLYISSARESLREAQETISERNAAASTGLFGFGPLDVAKYQGLQKRSFTNELSGLTGPATQFLNQEAQRVIQLNPKDSLESQLKRFRDGGDGMVREMFSFIARVRQVPVETVQRQFERALVNLRRQDQAERAALESRERNERSVSAFGRIPAALGAAQDFADQGLAGLQAQQAAFAGQLYSARPLAGLGALSQLGRGDDGALGPLRLIRNAAGEDGSRLFRAGETANRLQPVLTQVLSSVAAQGLSGIDAETTFATQVEKLVRAQLGRRPGEDEGLDAALVAVRAGLSEISGGGKGVRGITQEVAVDVTKLSERLLSRFADPVKDAGSKAGKLIEEAGGRLTDALKAASEQLLQVEELSLRRDQSGLSLKRAEAQVRASRVFGSPQDFLSLDDLLGPERERLRRLTGGANPDPAALGARLAAVQAQIPAAARDQREAFFRTGGGVNGNAFEEAARRLNGLNEEAARLRLALTVLADASARAGASQEKLSRLNEERSSRLSFGASYISSDFEQRARTQRSLVLVAGAADRGNLDNLIPEDQRAVLETLRSLGKAKLTGVQGQPTADQLYSTLVDNTLGGVFKQDAGARDERRGLEDRLVQAFKDEARAREVLVKNQERSQQTFLDGMRSIQNDFLTRLRQIFTADRVAALEAERGAVGEKLGPLGKLNAQAELLRSAGINTDTGLQTVLGKRDALAGYAEAVRARNEAQDNRRKAIEQIQREAEEGTGLFESFREFRRGVGGKVGYIKTDVNKKDIADYLAKLNIDSTGIPEEAAQGTFLNFIGKKEIFSPAGATLEGFRQRIADQLIQAIRKRDIDPNFEKAITNARSKIGTVAGADGGKLLTAATGDRSAEFFKALEDLGRSPVKFQELGDKTKRLEGEFEDLGKRIDLLKGDVVPADAAPRDFQFAKGGVAYRASGGVMGVHPGSPRGTDTIPAWLTENEFVINADSTRANLRLLKAINEARGPLRLARGGAVYAAGGRLFKNVVDPLADGLDEFDPVLEAIKEHGLGRPPLLNIFRPEQLAPPEADFRPELPAAPPLPPAPKPELPPLPKPRPEAARPVVEDPLEKELRLQARLNPFGRSAQLLRRRALERRHLPFGGDRARIGDRDVGATDNAISAALLAQNTAGKIGSLALQQSAVRGPGSFFGVGRADQEGGRNIYLRALQRRAEQDRLAENQDLRTRLFKSQRAPGLLGLGLLGFQSGGVVPSVPEAGGTGRDAVLGVLGAGEGVLNARAMARLGAPALHYLNRGGAVRPLYAGLGKVAERISGPAGVSPEVAQGLQKMSEGAAAFASAAAPLAVALDAFSRSADKLSEALSRFPGTLTVSGQQRVDVVINGAEALSRLTPEIEKMVADKVKDGLSQVFKKYLPEAGVSVD